jgi:hypothetical protein
MTRQETSLSYRLLAPAGISGIAPARPVVAASPAPVPLVAGNAGRVRLRLDSLALPVEGSIATAR